MRQNEKEGGVCQCLANCISVIIPQIPQSLDIFFFYWKVCINYFNLYTLIYLRTNNQINEFAWFFVFPVPGKLCTFEKGQIWPDEPGTAIVHRCVHFHPVEMNNVYLLFFAGLYEKKSPSVSRDIFYASSKFSFPGDRSFLVKIH